MPTIGRTSVQKGLLPLRLGKNMTQLHAEADKVDKNIDAAAIRSLLVSIDKLQAQGARSLSEGDQETAYVSFYRLSKTYLAVRKKPGFKEHENYLNKFFPPTKAQAIMKKCEELGEILAERYEKEFPEHSEKALMEKLNSAKTSKPLNGIRQDLPDLTETPKSPEKDKVEEESVSNGIKVDELRTLIEQKCSRLLILDCRSSSDYEKSHVKHSNCISIPDSILAKGQSANKITEKLQALTDGDYRYRMLNLWDTREKFDRIILYDWKTSFDSRDLDSPISVLYDALTKWDVTRKYHRLPEVVSGGYREITYKYPTMLTNPTLGGYEDQTTSESEPASRVSDLSSISYPNFDNDEDDLSARANKLRIGDSSLNMTKASNSSTVNVVNNNLPAKTTSAASVTLPDRSKKPTKIMPKVSATETPAPQKQNGEIGDEDGAVKVQQAAEIQNERRNSQNDVPGQITIPDRNVKPPRIFSSRSVNDTSHQNGYAPAEETSNLTKPNVTSRPSPSANQDIQKPETRSPSKSATPKDNVSYGFQRLRDDSPSSGLMNGDAGDKTMKSTMKRSRSIPNLKKLGDEDDLSRLPRNEPKPTYERSLKPTSNKSSFEAYAGRRRDFDIVSSSTRCVTGLKNLGNTCYMNSILQCLLSTPQLVDYFLGIPSNPYLYRRDVNSQSKTKGHVTEEFAAVIREINNGHRSIALNDFVSATSRLIPNARYGEQQDSHEFLVHLINSLHDELNKVRVSTPLKEQNNDNLADGTAAICAWDNFKSLNDSIMIDLFWGQQKSCVTCLNCHKRSVTFEPISVLSIPIRSAKRCDIKACLDLYTSEEEVPEYLCVHCKRKVRATKKLDLWKLPMYLIIQFQRFYDDGFLKKRVTEIDFPLENLDISPYVKGGGYNQYNLYGVSNHMGTMEGGHYTAYCRRSNNWHEFDDSVVRQLGRKQDIVTQNGYIVFYQRI